MQTPPAAGPLALLAATLLLSGPVFAIAQRTFVASSGVDNPLCSIVSPCRGFAAAIAATASGGEVIVVDSAGYGSLTITTPVSIIAPAGVYAGISVLPGTDGVTINAGPGEVVLRGLTINGQGGANGIHVVAGGSIHVEDCIVANLSNAGVFIEGGAEVHLLRVIARGNGADGVLVTPATATALLVTVSDSVLKDNGHTGLFVFTTTAGSAVHATVSRVTASRNASSGFAINSNGTGTAHVAIADCLSTLNDGDGLFVAGANATALLSGSTITKNQQPNIFLGVGAVVLTAQNNALSGTNDLGGGTLTPNPLQ